MDVTNLSIGVIPDIPENQIPDVSITPEKPFNTCIHCRYLRNGCSGPNPFAMEIERMWEFLELVRMSLGWSYSKVADTTGIAVGNVKKNMTNQVKDPSFHTVRLIVNALLGDPNGKYPCPLNQLAATPESEIIGALTKENQSLREELLQTTLNKDWLKRDWEFKRARLETQDLIIRHLMGANSD